MTASVDHGKKKNKMDESGLSFQRRQDQSYLNSHSFHIFTTFVTAILSEQANVNFPNILSQTQK